MVKMADRITNLQPPPEDWSQDKKEAYRDEAREIHKALKDGCQCLSKRLEEKIGHYLRYI